MNVWSSWPLQYDVLAFSLFRLFLSYTCTLSVSSLHQVATVLLATARIAVVAQIIPSYSPGGASIHPHLTRGSLGLRTSTLNGCISVGSAILHDTGVPNTHKDTETYNWQQLTTDFIEHTCSLRELNCWINYDIDQEKIIKTRGNVLSWEYRSPRKRNSRPSSTNHCPQAVLLLIYYRKTI